MRKSTLAILATIFAAITLAALPLSKALAVCEECVPPPQPPPNNPTSSSTHSSSNAGPWVVGCTMLSAGALIVGTVAQANDRRDPRQLTPTEAAWLAAVCPGFLPIALLNQTTCPDNRATYRIARLAYRFLRRHPQGDQTPFVNAYTEACRTGRLTRETRIQLRSLIR